MIDADPPVVTTQPMANSRVRGQPLFFAERLSLEEHQLTITVGEPESEGLLTAPYILQKFFVFPNSNAATEEVSIYETSQLPPSPSPTTTPPPKTPESGLQSASSNKTIHILAGALGSLLVVVVLLVILFLILAKRRRQSQNTHPYPASKGETDTMSSTHLCGGAYTEGTILTSTESILNAEIMSTPSYASFYRLSQPESYAGAVPDLDRRSFHATRPPPPPPVPPVPKPKPF
ncbi:hypothetical protein H0H81_012182 [Sphagnurus paluster]|uniref:Uncharacterized protein n=1 Tax=Sphagnurus paluster TaxID=117069 RepID=A0A9P7KJ68_9AGAR|nr:hypothetical protein H0H81_012182 [Sphagnurus paluster]